MDLVDFFSIVLRNHPDRQRTLIDTVLEAVSDHIHGMYEYVTDLEKNYNDVTIEEKEFSRESGQDLADRMSILLALSDNADGNSSVAGYNMEEIEKTVLERRKRMAWRYQDGRKVHPNPFLSQMELKEGSGENRNTSTTIQPKPPLRLIDLNRRPGRRPQYDWPTFAAEMARYCRVSVPADQAELERHMKEWCVKNWGGEPSDSVIRDWVAPTFKAVRGTENAA